MNEKFTCTACGSMPEAVKGTVIYPYRADLYDRVFWLCKCGAYVGAHKNGNPLGRPALQGLRDKRKEAHALFDPIWRLEHAKRNNMPAAYYRNNSYRWLANQMGICMDDCHIGMFDMAQIEKALRILHFVTQNRKRAANAKAINRKHTPDLDEVSKVYDHLSNDEFFAVVKKEFGLKVEDFL